jgi:deoxyribodipyrimidine photo-lyase
MAAEHALTLFWFRRDLRLEDNKGLYFALKDRGNVLGLFIFDTDILQRLEDSDDARVTFIHDQLSRLRQSCPALLIRIGRPAEVFRVLMRQQKIGAVYINEDIEPYATQRDQEVEELLGIQGIPLVRHLDHLIHAPQDVLKSDGSPYTVFTPYARTWKQKLETGKKGNQGYEALRHYPSDKEALAWASVPAETPPSLEDLGFTRSPLVFPDDNVPQKLIRDYADNRDFPALKGTSRLGVHFRFGTISIREKARKALSLSPVFLNELIWRDFYAQILAHFPRVIGEAFKPAYDRIEWRNSESDFKRWCRGETGFPLVDAGMRELLATGFMHNRVRMVTASFLSKHLLIDWRWGEAWFARKLLDFDLASNNGGWQWAAGCGTDAAPYFRIFNPEAQQKRFDPSHIYIRQWVPVWGTPAYPKPIVDHAFARERCLQVYRKALQAP